MRGSAIKITGDVWRAEHDVSSSPPFRLSIGGNDNETIVELAGVSFGDLDEAMSMPEKCVAHEYMDGDGTEVETISVIPFGEEPRISRKFEYHGEGGIVRITTNIDSRPVENLLVDKLSIKGIWKRFAALEIPSDGFFPCELSWEDLPSGGESKILSLNAPFLALLLENAEGVRLEISTGFDLWRWGADSAEKVEVSLSSTADDTLVLERRLFKKIDSGERHPKSRTRLNWQLAWINAADSADGVETAPIDWNPSLPDSAMASWNGARAGVPCLRSKPARAALRKAIRKIPAFQGEGGKTYSIAGLEPGICDAPAHLERSGKKRLPHWTLDELLDFHFWANRHLRPKNASFAISFDDGGIFAELPSLKRLGTPTTLGALSVERRK